MSAVIPFLPPSSARVPGDLWLADRVGSWLAAARGGLDPAGRRHFLATLGPDLVRAFQAEEEDLARTGPWGLPHRMEVHRELAQRLGGLLRGEADGLDVSAGIRGLLEAWLRHHGLPDPLGAPGLRQPVAWTRGKNPVPWQHVHPCDDN